MSREFHNLESYIKQGKSPSKIYKSNLMNLSRSTIFERYKRYKEDSSNERKSGSGRKIEYRNTLCHIPPKKRTFYHFSVGEHDNCQQFEQLIFIEIT